MISQVLVSGADHSRKRDATVERGQPSVPLCSESKKVDVCDLSVLGAGEVEMTLVAERNLVRPERVVSACTERVATKTFTSRSDPKHDWLSLVA